MNKECYKDCLGCSNSMSIPNEESINNSDNLFCIKKQEIVEEDFYCKEYN